MFTGIIEALGTVAKIEQQGGDVRLTIESGSLSMDDVRLGDSIAVNGVCLTVVDMDSGYFAADVSGETLSVTSIGGLRIGSRVNLEKAMAAGDRFGGHMVSGHVDGLARVASRKSDGRSDRFSFEVPGELVRYIAQKGSVTIDGTSLTINGVEGCRFDINVIPHTMEHTIISEYQVGSLVNIEVDIVARYLESLLQSRVEVEPSAPESKQQ